MKTQHVAVTGNYGGGSWTSACRREFINGNKTRSVHLGFDIPVQHTLIMNVLHTQAHLHKPVKDLKRVTEEL